MRTYLASVFITIIAAFYSCSPDASLPQDHLKAVDKTSQNALDSLVLNWNRKDHIQVIEFGHSVQRRNIYLIRIARDTSAVKWKLFFYGQQHGNEPAGKEAIIWLAEYLAQNPSLIPLETELWLMPSVNPDGGESDLRRNANGVDLNRDHLLLSQPETRLLHKAVRMIRPHVSIDCHEFTRDSRDYREKGWLEWPEIMMDCANNPNLNGKILDRGVYWCEKIERRLAYKNINFKRYYVGGLPPSDEQRHSTPEVDDARNGLALYGGLSFIIESGIQRNQKNPNFDLGNRIDAYLNIFQEFMNFDPYTEVDLQIIRNSRKAQLPAAIATNYFWVRSKNTVNTLKVIRSADKKLLDLPAPNFMNELITKESVLMPDTYVISPNAAADFSILLDRQKIAYTILNDSQVVKMRKAELVRVEEKFDPLYNRYGGRQIVNYLPDEGTYIMPGSLIVKTDQQNWRILIHLLEPKMLYGLYQFPEWRKWVTEDRILPVSVLVTDATILK